MPKGRHRAETKTSFSERLLYDILPNIKWNSRWWYMFLMVLEVVPGAIWGFNNWPWISVESFLCSLLILREVCCFYVRTMEQVAYALNYSYSVLFNKLLYESAKNATNAGHTEMGLAYETYLSGPLA